MFWPRLFSSEESYDCEYLCSDHCHACHVQLLRDMAALWPPLPSYPRSIAITMLSLWLWSHSMDASETGRTRAIQGRTVCGVLLKCVRKVRRPPLGQHRRARNGVRKS